MRISEKLKSQPGMRRLKAVFVAERYVQVGGKKYPVLLNECRKVSYYEERAEDEVPGDAEWWQAFARDVANIGVVALCRQEGVNDWPFVGLFEVDRVRMTNLLTCRFVEKLAVLHG